MAVPNQLTDEDIIRLGEENGLRIAGLPDSFYPGHEPEMMEQLKLELGLRATELAHRQATMPEGTND